MTDKTLNNYSSFTKELLTDAVRGSQHQNVVFSPLSVFVLLEMMAELSKGRTKDEIVAAIGDREKTARDRNGDAKNQNTDALTTLTVLKSQMENEPALRIANAVFASENYADSIKSACVRNIREKCSGEVFAGADFAELVNQWVSRKTDGMIPSVLDESQADTEVGLANALYFNSEWDEPYDEEDIRPGTFHNSDRSTCDVTYLNSREFSYIEDGFFTGFTKPYQSGFDFMALLPKKTGRHFLEGMLEQVDLTKLYNSAEFGIVKAQMPEFKCGCSEDLSGFLKEHGIVTAFTEKADFTPMTEKPAWISSVLHKAEIEVSREGTKAAAVTFAAVVGCAPDFKQKVHVVKLNRPFLFAIVHRDTGLPVFAGMVNRL